MKIPFHDHPDLAECPHCGEWDEGTRGCWLCDDAWVTDVQALRTRHGLHAGPNC